MDIDPDKIMSLGPEAGTDMENTLNPHQRLMMAIVRHCGPVTFNQMAKLMSSLLVRMSPEEAIAWVIKETTQ